MMKRGCNSQEDVKANAGAPAASSGSDSRKDDELQPRNPRHLQWELRFSQLQRFKSKYRHAQVPIGWPENVQLANWVSKQRQEYKNLLRGRATRLDENRIRLLNSLGFAWQLQRGGRRRQLKAHDRKKQSDGDSASPGGGAGASDNDTAEPCILPGEVLIGQGAPTSPGAPQTKIGIRDSQSAPTRCNQSGRPKEPTKPSPQHQPRQQPLQQLLPSSSSIMGMPFLNTTTGPSQATLAAPNNDLLDYVLARNALMQNLQAPQAVLRGGSNYPRLGLQTVSTTAPSHSLTSPGAQRNALLSVFVPQPSSLYPLPATASMAGTNAASSTGGTNSSWSTSSGQWSSITSSVLDAAPGGGARISSGIGATDDECKLSDGASRYYKNQLQQLQQQQQQQYQQQQQFQSNQSLPFSSSTTLCAPFNVSGTGNPGSEDQLQQVFPPHY